MADGCLNHEICAGTLDAKNKRENGTVQCRTFKIVKTLVVEYLSVHVSCNLQFLFCQRMTFKSSRASPIMHCSCQTCHYLSKFPISKLQRSFLLCCGSCRLSETLCRAIYLSPAYFIRLFELESILKQNAVLSTIIFCVKYPNFSLLNICSKRCRT